MSPDSAARATFARLARAAIEKRVAEARTESAHWGFKPNLAWVRWTLADGRSAFLGLRRHLDWVTGEVAVSTIATELEQVSLANASDPTDPGRLRLGDLLGEDDRWWPTGETPADQAEQLEWIALQLRVHLERRIHPHTRRQD